MLRVLKNSYSSPLNYLYIIYENGIKYIQKARKTTENQQSFLPERENKKSHLINIFVQILKLLDNNNYYYIIYPNKIEMLKSISLSLNLYLSGRPGPQAAEPTPVTL